MDVLIYLIPIALVLGGVGLVAFIWALRSGQFEDLDGAAMRILNDDDAPTKDTEAQEDQAATNDRGTVKSNNS